MRIKLNYEKIIANLYSEEELADLSIMESIYSIRKLKALAESLKDGCIDARLINNKAYSDYYEIYFNDDEYLKK